MRLAPQYEFSEEQEEALRKARILEWITLAYLASVIVLMYLVMGSSQAMKTAWIEDLLSLIPPICFLIASRICWREPRPHYPYGFHRVVVVFHLCAAMALLVMGGFLLIDSSMKLIAQEHPTIGMKEYFGVDLWLGWWMIAVLALWATVPPVLLGRAKIPLAETLNDKILITDGKMNKADWMTAAAAIGGVLGIGFGWWWADSVAAGFISFDILKDGWKQTRDAVTALINRSPTSIHGGYLDLPERAAEALEALPWVECADVRLYEHGHLFFGEGFVHPVADVELTSALLDEAAQAVRDLDWRLSGFIATAEDDVGRNHS